MKQDGLVLVFSLLVLMSLTILGVSSVTSGLMQNKMASSIERESLAFDAAEAAISGVVFEAEDPLVLSNNALLDPLSEAMQGAAVVLANGDISCFAAANWTNRWLTSTGTIPGSRHVTAGAYNSSPQINSWSKTAYVRQQACIGSSNVIGGSNISCQVFVIRGCGQISGNPLAVANTLNASVFAPTINN